MQARQEMQATEAQGVMVGLEEIPVITELAGPEEMVGVVEAIRLVEHITQGLLALSQIM